MVRFFEVSWNHRCWWRGKGGDDVPYLKGKNRIGEGNLKSHQIQMQVYFMKANRKRVDVCFLGCLVHTSLLLSKPGDRLPFDPTHK